MITHRENHTATAFEHFNLDRWGSGLPAQAYERATELKSNYERKQTEIFEARRSAAADATRRYRESLTSYLGGPDRYHALKRLLCIKRAHYREGIMRNPNARRSISEATLSEINAIINASGKNPNEIKAIAHQTIFSQSGPFSAANFPGGSGQPPGAPIPPGTPVSVPVLSPSQPVPPPPIGQPPSNAPGQPVQLKPDSPILFTSFMGCSSSHNLVYPKDGYAGFKNLTDCTQNVLGSDINMGTGDAGDADIFEATADCWLELYLVAGPNRIRIDVEAYGLDGKNHLHTHDEVGWSDSKFQKNVSLFAHVMALSGPTVNELMCYDPWWDWGYQTDGNRDINDDISFAGKRLDTATGASGITPFILGSNPVMPFINNSALNGSYVLIRIGIRRNESIFTNDVSIQSETDGRIHIASVTVSNFP